MSRPVESKIVTEGKRRFVNVQFTDHPRREHFMDIEVRVEHGGVALISGQYDGQIYFPLSILSTLVKAIEEGAGDA